MRRNGLISLVFIVLLAGGSLGYTFVADNEPLLGLDLQGGISVVLEAEGEADGDAIGQAIDIIRRRIDGLGVAEPEIARQGDAIVVQVPGVKDRERVLELVGQTAELQFRPVLQVLNYIPPEGEDVDDADTDADTDADSGDGDGDGADPDADADSDADTDPDAGASEDDSSDDTAPTTVDGDDADEPTSTTEADETTTTAGDEEAAGLGPIALGESAAPPFQTDPEDSETSDPDAEPAEEPILIPGPDVDDPATLGGEDPFDPQNNDLLPARDRSASFLLGPVGATGEILSGAQARLDQFGAWFVAVEFTSDGLSQFNQLARLCNTGDLTCPTRQLAIVLDGQVESAPVIQQPSFDRSGVSITGSFSEREAKDLALVLRYGALPVELVAQETRSVSATIGKDALDAGVTAGLVGLAFVALYMLVYYRLLGLVAMLSLAVSAALLWSVVAWLGESQGLALTLAGVTGIIVSIGVAVDSNVVFYEHLKEDVSKGRTLRSAIDGSFTSAFSTIVKADVASLIGAAVLYFLTVGPVRGFAFYLGLSTVLDLVSSYFFMRPLSHILVRSKALQDRPRVFGMPANAIPAEVA